MTCFLGRRFIYSNRNNIYKTNKNELRPEVERRIKNANRVSYALLPLLKVNQYSEQKK